MQDDTSTRKRSLWIRYGFIALATALMLAPAAAYASHTFTDVPDTNIFHNDIQWMADNDITAGCGGGGTLYCPTDNVTRQQMSAFMRRLAENQVVDAATALEADNATTADDADTLDGLDSAGFVQKGEANSVDSSMIVDEPSVAQQVEASGFALSGPTEDVASVTIEAPAAGTVIVWGSAEFVLSHTTGTSTLAIPAISDTSATAPGGGFVAGIGVPSGAATGSYFQIFSSQRAFPVAAGSHTFYLVASESSGSVSVDDTVLTALFVSTTGGTVDTAGAPTGIGEDATDGS